jgi:hypothetical protein
MSIPGFELQVLICHYNIDMLRNEFPISREKKKLSKSEFFINLNLFEF